MKFILTFSFMLLSCISKADDLECLSLNIYHEARGESTQGWLAVAFVTMNRLNSNRFPDSICEVVYQPYQFSWTQDGISDTPDLSRFSDRQAWKYIQQFSKGFLENYENIVDPTEGSMYYHTYQINPSWSQRLNEVVQIDNHIFYKEN